MRAPYRVHLPLAGRRVRYSRLQRAATACLQVDGWYVVEHHDGAWTPLLILHVDRGREVYRELWTHERAAVAGLAS